MNDITFREVQPGSADYEAAVRLRAAVLRQPLGLEFTAQEMADEPRCFHLVAVTSAEVVGTLLLKPLDARMLKMRQVAVRPDLQRVGVGAALVHFAEAFARERGFDRIVAHARDSAVGFYERLGYSTEGAPLLECTIPHRVVVKAFA
jgi:predicted N-acetyltransferase YhbS